MLGKRQQNRLLTVANAQPPGPAGRFFIVHPIVLHFTAHQSASRRTVMKAENALTVSPTSGLSELKRAKSLIRLTESILGTPMPARNRTDEQGRKQGYWVEHDVFNDGDVCEGTYVDGEKHGHWVERDDKGYVCEGPYVDGKEQGHWVLRWGEGGDEEEGPFVDGKRHGHWVWRYTDNSGYLTVWKGPYVDGEKHGRWVWWGADISCETGEILFVNGKEHGHWNGKEYGHWVERLADGGVVEGPIVDGKRHGHWVFRWADGTVWEGPFVNHKTHGHWVFRSADGAVWEGPFVNDKKHGKWVWRFADGVVSETCWENGNPIDC